VIRYQQNAVLCEFVDEAVDAALRLFSINVEFLANFASDDFRQWPAPVRCLPNRRSDFIEREKIESAVDITIISPRPHSFSPTRANSPAKVVPQVIYRLPLRRHAGDCVGEQLRISQRSDCR
jgi:hypothetical protein